MSNDKNNKPLWQQMAEQSKPTKASDGTIKRNDPRFAKEQAEVDEADANRLAERIYDQYIRSKGPLVVGRAVQLVQEEIAKHYAKELKALWTEPENE